LYLSIIGATAKTPMMRTLFHSLYYGKVMQATGKGKYGAE